MTRRILDVLGFLCVLGLLGACGALVLMKQPLHVSIAGETSAHKAGPDPVALLRDDVASLRGDLTSLATTLSKNFEALAPADAQSAADRAKSLDEALNPLRKEMRRVADAATAALTRTESQVNAALSAQAAEAAHDAAEQQKEDERWATATAALKDLKARLAALSSAPASSAPAAPVASTPAATPAPRVEAAAARSAPAASAASAMPPPPPPPVPLSPAVSVPKAAESASAATATAVVHATAPAAAAPSAPSTAAAAPPSASPSAPAAKRRSFLSFALPSESLDLHSRLKFEIVPSLSRVGFDARSTLHDFSGVTSDVTGQFTASLAQPGTGTSGRVVAQVSSIDTGIVERNDEMAKTMETSRLPTIEFALLQFDAASVDARTLASTGTGRGKMTIHGVTRDVAVPLRISLDESRRVVIEGEVPLRLTDYGVRPPSTAGLIKMEDEVRVWVALRARAIAKGE